MTAEIQLWLISGLLTLIAVLIAIIYANVQKKMDEMMRTQNMFIEEISEIKADIAKSLSWLKAHEKRLDNLDARKS